ncbi:hypothetical protein FACS1894106_1600 [Spirochaetia bacterium]|nr:hypothetical protein FACS1894106_1600 [Spirochaetia bacterium]
MPPPAPHKSVALITSTGYAGTGSSAGTNILEEFMSVKSMNNEEFTFLHDNDGIGDLEDALKEGHRLKTDLAIKRFLKLSHDLMRLHYYKQSFSGKFEQYSNEFVDSIVKCKWQGWWERAFEMTVLSKTDKFRIKFAEATYDFLIKANPYDLYEPDSWRPHQYKPVTTTYYSNISSIADEAFFLNQVRVFTSKLLAEENSNDAYKYILLDQAVPPISISKYARYWENPKILVIDRDPRDLYVLVKAVWGWPLIPAKTVEQFIVWYQATRQLRENESQNQFLFLPFESLIYEYDNSLKRIIEYTELSESNHIHKLQHFNPELSQKNTQIFRQYPELTSDINKIEKTLEKYCYRFPESRPNIPLKKIYIQEINEITESVQETGALPKQQRKHLLSILFFMTHFSKNWKEIQNRKGIKLFKLFIKLGVSLVLLPFELIIYSCWMVGTKK